MMFTSVVRTDRNRTIPLLTYLSARFTYHTADEWHRRIIDGKVMVDGRNATPDDTVNAGQTVTYDAGPIDEPPADLSYTIIYEDEWVFAVNKPGNLLVHRAGKSFTNNLMYQLRTAGTPPRPSAHSIHRLDRNTSGVVLIAKSAEIMAEISRQFQQRHIDKKYIAFIEESSGTIPDIINAPIAEDKNSAHGARFHVAPDGKEAITRIISVESISAVALKIHLQPLTGRTHQLRVHCAHIGRPIIGDRTYGSQTSFGDETRTAAVQQPLHPRHALHCAEITFFHPWLKEERTICAPLPDDMIELERELKN